MFFEQKVRKLTILILALGLFFIFCQGKMDNQYMILIDKGEFTEAKNIIKQKLETETDVSEDLRNRLEFEIERMERIKKDFIKTESDVLEYIREYIPDVLKEPKKIPLPAEAPPGRVSGFPVAWSTQPPGVLRPPRRKPPAGRFPGTAG